ncbi:MAG: CvpA family protein [Saprospiraceae bacterium]|nr:CvpA family protein [Saprospiraceae bacterium]
MAIDIVCLAVFGFGFWKGYRLGIIGTFFNILAYLFGAIVAYKMAPLTVVIIERLFEEDNPLVFPAAFIINLLFIVFLLRTAARSIEGALSAMYINVVNSMAGGVLSGYLSVMVLSFLLWFVDRADLLSREEVSRSVTYPYLERMPGQARSTFTRLRPLAEDFWGTSMNWIDRLEEYGNEKKSDPKSKFYDPNAPEDKGIEEDPEEADPRRADESVE